MPKFAVGVVLQTGVMARVQHPLITLVRPMRVGFHRFALAAALTLSFGLPVVAEAPAQKSAAFQLFGNKDNPSRAERKAERQAERAAKREERKAKKSKLAPSADSQSAARAQVKEAVAYAIAHRPKGRLWCVPFARTVSGVEIRGNAKTWWAQAKGAYQRGHEPQVGAVIAFASSRAMPKGHVGVVSQVISDREILVDHANWVRNRVTQDNLVVDVSAKGDWSAVKVANRDGTLGRVNPVNGFIYN